MKKILLTSCLIILTSSLNAQILGQSKLTTKEAEKIISHYYPTFCTSRDTRTDVTIAVGLPFRQSGAIESLKKLKKMEKQGFIRLKVRKTGFMDNPDMHYSLELTDESKLKYNNKIALTSNEFVEITGISQNENEAIVRYKVKSVKTPFYQLHYKNPDTGEYGCYETEWEEEETLIKFDTGWKLKK